MCSQVFIMHICAIAEWGGLAGSSENDHIGKRKLRTLAMIQPHNNHDDSQGIDLPIRCYRLGDIVQWYSVFPQITTCQMEGLGNGTQLPFAAQDERG